MHNVFTHLWKVSYMKKMYWMAVKNIYIIINAMKMKNTKHNILDLKFWNKNDIYNLPRWRKLDGHGLNKWIPLLLTRIVSTYYLHADAKNFKTIIVKRTKYNMHLSNLFVILYWTHTYISLRRRISGTRWRWRYSYNLKCNNTIIFKSTDYKYTTL